MKSKVPYFDFKSQDLTFQKTYLFFYIYRMPTLHAPNTLLIPKHDYGPDSSLHKVMSLPDTSLSLQQTFLPHPNHSVLSYIMWQTLPIFHRVTDETIRVVQEKVLCLFPTHRNGQLLFSCLSAINDRQRFYSRPYFPDLHISVLILFASYSFIHYIFYNKQCLSTYC